MQPTIERLLHVPIVTPEGAPVPLAGMALSACLHYIPGRLAANRSEQVSCPECLAVLSDLEPPAEEAEAAEEEAGGEDPAALLDALVPEDFVFSEDWEQILGEDCLLPCDQELLETLLAVAGSIAPNLVKALGSVIARALAGPPAIDDEEVPSRLEVEDEGEVPPDLDDFEE